VLLYEVFGAEVTKEILVFKKRAQNTVLRFSDVANTEKSLTTAVVIP